MAGEIGSDTPVTFGHGKLVDHRRHGAVPGQGGLG